MVLRDLLPGTHWKQLLNLPGANPAAAGVPMDGWENTWEKADACDWDVLLSLEVDPPLGINSLAVGFGVYLKIKYSKSTHFKPKKDTEFTRYYSTVLYLPSKIFYWKDLQCFLVSTFWSGIIKFLEEKFSIKFEGFNHFTWGI